MSTKKKGLLTTSGEWAKHLRPYLKRRFWKTERATARKLAQRRENHDSKAGDGERA
jgi:hypothetical protein